MSKVKYYHVFGRTTANDGKERVVTIVGKFEQSRKPQEITETVDVETLKGGFVQGELKYKIKTLKRKLTLGLSICHPLDTFDEEVGVEIAKSRINKGVNLGSIETSDVTMLTEDAIFAEMVTKLNHVLESINEFIVEDDE
jgi:hypothetical protein